MPEKEYSNKKGWKPVKTSVARCYAQPGEKNTLLQALVSALASVACKSVFFLCGCLLIFIYVCD